MTPLAPDQWVLLALAFLLGLFFGMYLLAGGKWKRRYREQDALHREELRRRDSLEADRRSADAQTLAARDGRLAPGDPGPVVPPTRRSWFGRR